MKLFNLFKRNKNNFDDLFCTHLAKLFYSVASADQVVAEEEVNAFKTLIKKEWEAPKVLNKHQVNIILKEFKKLVATDASSNHCFESFKSYIENNKIRIKTSVKNLIWKTADGIASSYANKNKSEVILFAKLKSMLLDLPDG